MCRILQFTEDEKKRVLTGRKNSTLGGRLSKLTSFLPSLSPFDDESTKVYSGKIV